MSSKRCFYLFLSLLLISVLVVGCGPSRPPRIPVHGTVTMDGQPAQEGEVRFVPIGDEQGGPARAQGSSPIVDGEYKIESGGGLQQGRYRVEVEVKEKTGNKTMVDTGFEMVEADEMVLVSSEQYAGEDSPLNFTAESGSEERFDVDVPAK